MSLGDLPRQTADDIATVLALAATVEDRTRGEQAALDRLAAKVDKLRNRQTRFGNPWLPEDWQHVDPSAWPPCTYRLTEDRRRPEVNEAAVSADFPVDAIVAALDHPKDCPCRGDGRAVEPVGGWSRLTAEVAS